MPPRAVHLMDIVALARIRAPPNRTVEQQTTRDCCVYCLCWKRGLLIIQHWSFLCHSHTPRICGFNDLHVMYPCWTRGGSDAKIEQSEWRALCAQANCMPMTQCSNSTDFMSKSDQWGSIQNWGSRTKAVAFSDISSGRVPFWMRQWSDQILTRDQDSCTIRWRSVPKLHFYVLLIKTRQANRMAFEWRGDEVAIKKSQLRLFSITSVVRCGV